MIDGFDILSLENIFYFGIHQVHTIKRGARVHLFPFSGRQVIQNHNAVAFPNVSIDDVRADKTGSAGNQNIHIELEVIINITYSIR